MKEIQEEPQNLKLFFFRSSALMREILKSAVQLNTASDCERFSNFQEKLLHKRNISVPNCAPKNNTNRYEKEVQEFFSNNKNLIEI